MKSACIKVRYTASTSLPGNDATQRQHSLAKAGLITGLEIAPVHWHDLLQEAEQDDAE